MSRDHDHNIEQAPTCKASFESIHTAVTKMTDTMVGVQSSVNGMGERLARQEETTRSLWKELREDVSPSIRQLPDRISRSIREHKVDCPAHGKVMAKAMSDSDQTIPIPNQLSQYATEPRKTIFSVPPASIIKWLFYIGLIIGGILAGVAGTSIALPNPINVSPKIAPK